MTLAALSGVAQGALIALGCAVLATIALRFTEW